MEDFSQNQILFFVLIMSLTAIPVGFFAGLFGIGGGLITVPFLFFIFGLLDLNQSYINTLKISKFIYFWKYQVTRIIDNFFRINFYFIYYRNYKQTDEQIEYAVIPII